MLKGIVNKEVNPLLPGLQASSFTIQWLTFQVFFLCLFFWLHVTACVCMCMGVRGKNISCNFIGYDVMCVWAHHRGMLAFAVGYMCYGCIKLEAN